MSDTKKKPLLHRAVNRVKTDNERGSRINIMEELFYDFNRSKTQVYWVNFQRGIFFGMGSVLGGALIIAVFGVVLSHFVDLPGGVGDFVKNVLNAMSRNR